MPVDTRINVPFIPQEGITGQILQALQLANEHHIQQGQIALQQQLAPSQIAQREAATALDTAQTDTAKFNLEARKKMFQSLTGTSIEQVGQPQQEGQPAPKGMISDVVGDLMNDPSLSDTEKRLIGATSRQAILVAYEDPTKALPIIIDKYNNIMTQHGDNARAIKTETIQDSKSDTGYSMRGIRPDGSEAYRMTSTPPIPKTLDESTSYLGSASLAYKNDPTPGNKAALDLYRTQHDAMYKDHLAEVEKQAAVTAKARGADVEAMFRTGKNPLTGEVLNLNNAPPSALVNPANGQVIPQDLITLYKPTQNERQTADTARQVLAISKDLQDEVTKNPDLIGPLAGRSQEGLQKLGLSAADASRMLDNVSFLQSAATKMHTGRFSSEILNKMGEIIKPGMNRDEFDGALGSINDVATRYANEDKLTTVYEYQQRQQFEAQEAKAAPATQAPPARPKGVPDNAVWNPGNRTWSVQ